jgi:pimeloyl-ACP methyl ester carboxylesterase
VARSLRSLADGTRYCEAGAGAPVILLHGVGLDCSIWQAQCAALAGDHRVIAYDLLGHGASPPIADDACLDDFVDQLTRLVEALVPGRQTLSLVGFSFGGLIAEAFALRVPERVARLAIIASVFDRSETERAGVTGRLRVARAEGPQALIEAALQRWYGPEFRASHPAAVEGVAAVLRRNDPRSFLAAYGVFAEADRDLAGRLSALAVPTLIVAGEHDSGATPAMARRLAALIPGATLAIVAGGRHMLPQEHARELNELLQRFLMHPEPHFPFSPRSGEKVPRRGG